MGWSPKPIISVVLVVLIASSPIWQHEDEASSSAPASVFPTSTIADIVIDQVDHDGFLENHGQVSNDGVFFYWSSESMDVGFTMTGLNVVLRSRAVQDRYTMNDVGDRDRAIGTRTAFTLAFVNCNDNGPRGIERQSGCSNFFLGDEETDWTIGVSSYRGILYENMYDGVDVRFHLVDGKVKYDLIVDGHVDIDTVRVRYRGVDGISIDPSTGDLLVSTRSGQVRDARPVLFQGAREEGTPGSFELLDEFTHGFSLPDGISSDRPYVIDPGLEFSTYLGGSESDHGRAIDVDGEGNVYVSGWTKSVDFPVTVGAFDEGHNGGDEDVFLTKMDPTGRNLLYSTFIGGSDRDLAHAMQVLSGGTVCLVGHTSSEDFPTTGNAYHTSRNGGSDAFIVNVGSDGSQLLYSTYFGGDKGEEPRMLHVDEGGDLYIAGYSGSTDLPVSSGAYRATNPGVYSGFVVKFDPSTSTVEFCTYLGGSGADTVNGGFVDDNGTTYIVGYTESSDFPVTSGAFSTTWTADSEAFVAAIGPEGRDLRYSTFITTTDPSMASSVVGSGDGRVCVAGITNATDFPVTPDANKTTPPDLFDVFLAVFDGSLSRLLYCTLVGGTDDDYDPIVDIGPDGETVFLGAYSFSSDLSTSVDAFDPLARGYEDGVLGRFDLTSYRLEYMTYLGGDSQDSITGIKVVDESTVLLTGWSTSIHFPVTDGAYCQTLSNPTRMAAFVCRLDTGPCGVLPPAITGLELELGMDNIVLSWDGPTTIAGRRTYAYNIHRGTKVDDLAVIETHVGNNTVYYDDSAFVGVKYYYRVSAVSTAGEGPLSSVVTGRLTGPPSEALDLTVSTGSGNASLLWNPPLSPGGDDLKYRVLRGALRNDLSVIVEGLAVTSFEDEDVEVGTFYYYAVQTYCEFGDGPLCEAVRIKVKDISSSPRDFTVTPGDGKVTLRWSVPGNDGGSAVIGYHVWRGTSIEDVQTIATLDMSSLSYTDNDVVNGRSYFYYVTAYTEVGEGTATITLDAIPHTVPGRVPDIVTTADDSSVLLEWTPPYDGGSRITKYKVYAGEGSGGDIRFLTTLGNVTAFNHTGLTNGVEYFYQVTAVNQAGEGQISETVSATPMGLPGPVRELGATAVRNGIVVTWQLPTDLGGAESLTVWIYEGDLVAPVSEYSTVGSIQFLDTNVTPGETYDYWARTETSFGWGPAVGPVAVTAVAGPGPVTELTTSIGDGEVRLTWVAPGDDGGSPVIEYIVKRGVFATGITEVARVPDPEYLDTGLDNGKTYLFVVVAVNVLGAGAETDPVEGTPLGPPAAPGMFQAEAKGRKVVLSWARPVGPDRAPVTGYRIMRGMGDEEPVEIAQVGDVTSYVDEDVEEGKKYYYQILGFSDIGDGQRSSTIDVKIRKEEDGPGFTSAALTIGILLIVVIHYRRR